MPVPVARLAVDFSVPAGVIRPLHGVNFGPLMMNGWLDVSAVYRELAFPLTRLHDIPYAVPDAVDIHCIFPNFDADPRDPRNYHFAVTDDYIQATLDTGSQIIYRLGESIEHHTRGKYHIHPPKDFAKWAEICVNIIRHYNQGWANGFHHDIRYWEIWNEPWLAQCWTGTPEEYFRLYETTAKAIKACDLALLVGGPTAVGGDLDAIGAFARNFLAHCTRTSAPLDFYSWHSYANDPVEIVESAQQLREALTQQGFSHAEIHLNEWSYLPVEGWRFNSPEKDADCIRRASEEIGGITGAAFIAAMLIYLQDCPVEVANYYWVRDGFWGILDSAGAKRKSFYAFNAFRALLDTPQRVFTTPNDAATGYALIAGGNDNGQTGVLLANFRAREAHFAVQLTGWPWSGNAVVKRYLLDYDRNLTLVEEHVLTDANAILNLCLPAPAFCYMTVTPE